MNGISSVTDSPRPGEAHRVVTPEAIAAVEAIVKENPPVRVNEIVPHPDMSHGSGHYIVHDKKYKKNTCFHLTHHRKLHLLMSRRCKKYLYITTDSGYVFVVRKRVI